MPFFLVEQTLNRDKQRYFLSATFPNKHSFFFVPTGKYAIHYKVKRVKGQIGKVIQLPTLLAANRSYLNKLLNIRYLHNKKAKKVVGYISRKS